MKSRSVAETAILCATAVIALAIVVAGAQDLPTTSIIWTAVAAVVTLAIVVVGGRYAIGSRHAQPDLSPGQEHRQLTDEYRRLADMAITTQEHTDLKLGEVAVQLDYLRGQVESMQKILEDVE
jgi:hypothetical protein